MLHSLVPGWRMTTGQLTRILSEPFASFLSDDVLPTKPDATPEAS